MKIAHASLVLALLVTAGAARGESDLRVGLVQFTAAFGDTAANLQRLEGLVADAASHGARLVVLPEGSSHGYATDTEVWCAPPRTQLGSRRCRDVTPVAEAVPEGPLTRRFTALAARTGAFVVFSAIERDGEELYNTAVVVGPQGYVTKYRKRSLYYLDTGYASPGGDPVVAELPIGRFGLMICADANDDDQLADYVTRGVDAVILPMDWDEPPVGPRGAAQFFASAAARHRVTILAADVAAWDGTALYPADGRRRQRAGLPEPGVGVDGVALGELKIAE